MSVPHNKLIDQLASIDHCLTAAVPASTGRTARAIDRWRADAAALRFHLDSTEKHTPIVVILGGTGTGKSTLVNRLLEANLTAASFRRTFTSGPVVIAQDPHRLPPLWLGVEPVAADAQDLPARGRPDGLTLVPLDHPLTRHVTLVDTPDMDGDQPAHHAQADRAFRWAQAVLFLVTPEKYQMTELLPYYRLAARYGLPVLFVMNKCEAPEMLDDYARLVGRTHPEAKVFAVARDDAAYEPPAEANLESLRRQLSSVQLASEQDRREGLGNRAADLIGRLEDQVLSPLRADRLEADRLIAALQAMEAPAAGIDVNPVTRQLQRRLQQRSVLYLMGPQRVLDRVRQVPALLVRLPRTAWDAVMQGRWPSLAPADAAASDNGRHVPDFRATLIDQFSILQSRIDDALRSSHAGGRWVEENGASYGEARIEPERAGKIVDHELAELKSWLEQRRNAAPRDTAVVGKLLKRLPGGEKLTQWSEAAPYLLAIVLATHHAFFGHIDLLVLGGYTLGTWISEKLNNEVAARTRQANRAIAERFGELAHEQIERVRTWIDRQTAPASTIRKIEQAAGEISDGGLV